jgi:double-stranded uracil-DNA glycosylase
MQTHSGRFLKRHSCMLRGNLSGAIAISVLNGGSFAKSGTSASFPLIRCVLKAHNRGRLSVSVGPATVTTQEDSRLFLNEVLYLMATLPDYLRKGMKLIVVGCNPSDRSARVGHYYAGRGNEFWPLLYDAGIVPELLDAKDDKRVIEFGVGLTNLVKRATRTAEEIDRQEFAEGRILLAQKLEEYAPRVIAFNGRTVYEKFAQSTGKLGLQKKKLYGAQVFVLPAAGAGNSLGQSVKRRYFRQLGELLRTLK